jgi:hypothetical protein
LRSEQLVCELVLCLLPVVVLQFIRQPSGLSTSLPVLLPCRPRGYLNQLYIFTEVQASRIVYWVFV